VLTASDVGGGPLKLVPIPNIAFSIHRFWSVDGETSEREHIVIRFMNECVEVDSRQTQSSNNWPTIKLNIALNYSKFDIILSRPVIVRDFNET
jgi:hypothetical protein